MSLRDSLKVKVTQAEQAAALLDKTADYAPQNVMGFYVKALCQGGKTYELQINPADAGYNTLLSGFTNLVAKARAAAQALLTAMGVQ